MLKASCFELPYDFGWLPGRLFNNRAFDRREIKRTAAQHDYRLVSIKSQVSELQHNLESSAAYHDHIYTGQEFLEPVRLLLTCVQEIERVIWASQKAIDTHSTEDREFNGKPPKLTFVIVRRDLGDLDFMPTLRQADNEYGLRDGVRTVSPGA